MQNTRDINLFTDRHSYLYSDISGVDSTKGKLAESCCSTLQSYMPDLRSNLWHAPLLKDIRSNLKWTVSLSLVTGQGTASGPWQAVRFLRVVHVNTESAPYGMAIAAAGTEKSVMAAITFERRCDRYISFCVHSLSLSRGISVTNLFNGSS